MAFHYTVECLAVAADYGIKPRQLHDLGLDKFMRCTEIGRMFYVIMMRNRNYDGPRIRQ